VLPLVVCLSFAQTNTTHHLSFFLPEDLTMFWVFVP
jgi:hypothetical protein